VPVSSLEPFLRKEKQKRRRGEREKGRKGEREKFSVDSLEFEK